MQEGDKVGPYTLREQVGSGGMGVVHRAETADGTFVAIKMLHPGIATAESRDRLAREVESQRRIRHANVAEVLDADTDCDRPYIVTQFINGPTLEARVKQDGALTRGELAVLGRGLGEALAAAHEAGVVHRDVKPTNILLESGSPILIDFGISHVADSSRITQQGLVMGTVGYLAPEVVSHAELTPATDWWGWAATMVYGATGEHPFGTGDYQVVMGRIYAGQPILEGVPGELRDVLRRSLVVTSASRPEPPDLRVAVAALQSAADAESGIPTTKLAHGPVADYVHLMSGRDAPPPGAPRAAADRKIDDPRSSPSSSEESGACGVRDRRLPDQAEPIAPSTARRLSTTPAAPVRPGPAGSSTAASHTPPGPQQPSSDSAATEGGTTEVLNARVGGDATEVLNARSGLTEPSQDGATEVLSNRPTPTAGPGGTKVMPTGYSAPAGDSDSEGVVHVRPIIEDLAPPSDPADHTPAPSKRETALQEQRTLVKGWSRRVLMEPGRMVLLTTFGAMLAIIGTVSPFALFTVGAIWAGAALTASASARALIRRHQEHGGPRPSDVPVLVMNAGWRFAHALLRLLMPIVLALLVGVAAGTATTLFVDTFSPTRASTFGTTVLSVVAMAVMWIGPTGPDLRYGSRAILRNVTPQFPAALLVLAVLALAVVSGVIVTSGPGFTPEWSPLPQAPWDYLLSTVQ